MSMNQDKNKPEQVEQAEQPKENARQTLVKRVLAWLGIIYILLTMVLSWVYIVRGAWLYNIGPLLTVPALLGFGVFQFLRYRKEKGSLLALLLLEALVLAATIYAFYVGIPALLGQL